MPSKFICEGCGKEFDKEFSMYSHQGSCSPYLEIKRRRQEELESTYEFVCEDCGRKFPRKTSLNAHYRHCRKHRERLDKERVDHSKE